MMQNGRISRPLGRLGFRGRRRPLHSLPPLAATGDGRREACAGAGEGGGEDLGAPSPLGGLRFLGRRPQPERRRRRAVGGVRRGAGQCAWPRGRRVVGGIRPRHEDSSSDLEVRNPFPATSLSPSAVACDLLSGPGVGASWWPARGPGETLAGPAGPAAATPKGAAFLHGGAAEVPCFPPRSPCPGENLYPRRI